MEQLLNLLPNEAEGFSILCLRGLIWFAVDIGWPCSGAGPSEDATTYGYDQMEKRGQKVRPEACTDGAVQLGGGLSKRKHSRIPSITRVKNVT